MILWIISEAMPGEGGFAFIFIISTTCVTVIINNGEKITFPKFNRVLFGRQLQPVDVNMKYYIIIILYYYIHINVQ